MSRRQMGNRLNSPVLRCNGYTVVTRMRLESGHVHRIGVTGNQMSQAPNLQLPEFRRQAKACQRRGTSFVHCCDGVAAIDYALLAGLVALAALGAFQFMGIAVGDMFNTISSSFAQAMPSGG